MTDHCLHCGTRSQTVTRTRCNDPNVFERELVRAAAGVGEGETRALAAFSIAVAGPALAAVPPEGLRFSVPAGEGGSAAVVRRACWASIVAARRGYRVVSGL